jgi:acyl-CoA synthetase (AMP-forming)/AMP-acid ligase II
MSASWLLERMTETPERDALIWRDTAYAYGGLVEAVRHWQQTLDRLAVGPGRVVAVEGDFSPQAYALLLALVERRAVVVPLTASRLAQRAALLEIAEVQTVISFSQDDRHAVEDRPRAVTRPLTRALLDRGAPGLVLFTSGSTGEPKAALHDFVRFLDKFKPRREPLRTLLFLLADHVGGLNTLFAVLANGGTAVIVPDRGPEAVCRATARHRVELLPTSPTFLNLLLLSEAYRRHDLSSLKLITYGTEVMPAPTLERLAAIYPGVRLKQTYGLTEVGILQSKSRDSGSTWVKVGGEGFEIKVVDDTLWVRAATAMLGYLNGPSPFDADGWLNTGDRVEVDGDYVRILGRDSERITVGGEKVYPAEVEDVLLDLENVADVRVFGERHAVVGQVVAAEIRLHQPEPLSAVVQRMRRFCRTRLAPYKVPVKVRLATDSWVGARFKKVRPTEAR